MTDKLPVKGLWIVLIPAVGRTFAGYRLYVESLAGPCHCRPSSS